MRLRKVTGEGGGEGSKRKKNGRRRIRGWEIKKRERRGAVKKKQRSWSYERERKMRTWKNNRTNNNEIFV